MAQPCGRAVLSGYCWTGIWTDAAPGADCLKRGDARRDNRAMQPEDVRSSFLSCYRACEALYDFARANRPEYPEDDDELGKLLFKTYVRASKSYQGSYKLAFDAYGA